MTRPRAITIFTHKSPEDTGYTVQRLIDKACEAGVEVRVPPDEAGKHSVSERRGVLLHADPEEDTDLAVVLGGDGTILETLRIYAGRQVPVFAFNFGEIGFLATVDQDEVDDGIRRVLTGDFELLAMPALAVDVAGKRHWAANDISFHRRPNCRVAELAYSVAGDQLGKVRCDGLVVSTPAGSTGYNLANGGPVLAWGVEGFVVSFIAPHTLTARALVVGPQDRLSVMNCSTSDGVDVTTDGRIVCGLGPLEELELSFEHDKVMLAHIPGATFYHRLREKFGRLAS
jgi:NAD+ kinase